MSAVVEAQWSDEPTRLCQLRLLVQTVGSGTWR